MKGFEHYLPKRWHSCSSLTCMARCPFRYFLKVGCRLADTTTAPALVFGSAIHAGIHLCYTGDVEGATAAWEKIWNEAGLEEDQKRNKYRAQMMFEDFARNFNEDLCVWKVLPPVGVEIEDRVSPHEVAFAVDVGLDVPYVGRIDALVQQIHTKELWGLEYKTTSGLGDSFLQAFEINPQLCTYTMALRASTQKPVRGMFLCAMLVALRKVETIAYPIFVTDAMVQDAIDWIRWQHHRIRACEKAQNFPKDISGCNTYAGWGVATYNCEFTTLCKDQDWTSMKENYYILPEREFQIKGTLDEQIVGNAQITGAATDSGLAE